MVRPSKQQTIRLQASRSISHADIKPEFRQYRKLISSYSEAHNLLPFVTSAQLTAQSY